MLVAQPRHLLGAKALAQGLLDVDDRELAAPGVEHVGIGVAVFHRLGQVVVQLIEVAGDEDQQARVIRLPARAVAPKVVHARLHLGGGHDAEQRLGQLERA